MERSLFGLKKAGNLRINMNLLKNIVCFKNDFFDFESEKLTLRNTHVKINSRFKKLNLSYWKFKNNLKI